MTQPASYLFVTWEGGGNVAPVLGLARGLLNRGHSVRVLSEPCHESAVTAAGARFAAFTEHFIRTDRNEDLIRDWEGSPLTGVKRTLDNVIVGPAETVAEQTERALDREPADVVVVDFMMPGAGVVAEARGLPFAFLVHSIDMEPGRGRPGPGMRPATGVLGELRDRFLRRLQHRIFDGYLGAFNAVRQKRGLEPLRHLFDQYHRADRYLVQTCRDFDFPLTSPAANLRYVGPVIDEPEWLPETEWRSPFRDGAQRPLVLASLSTTFQNQETLLQKILDALGRLDVSGLVTLGPAMAGCDFSVPTNVVAVDRAPHGLVLPHVSTFVTHCGHGSVMRSLAHGVPMVALPMGRDQGDIAARIEERGLGLRAKRRPDSIAEAIDRVTSEPRFRKAAQEFSKVLATDVSENRGVAELEQLATCPSGGAQPIERDLGAQHRAG